MEELILSLPSEILELILLNLNNKQIILASQTCKRFYAFRTLIDKKKIKGFPRIRGKCQIIEIPKNEEKDTLNYIYDSDINVIFGDLIVFNCHHKNRYHGLYNGIGNIEKCDIRIFDGVKLQKLEYSKDDYRSYDYFYGGRLIDGFNVIQNDVPILYWDFSFEFFSTCFVRFDQTIVKDQCINNIKYDRFMLDVYGIYTWFIYNDKKYYIIYNYYDYYDYIIRDIDEKYADDLDDQNDYKILNNKIIVDFIQSFKEKLNRNDNIFTILTNFDIIKNNGSMLFLEHDLAI